MLGDFAAPAEARAHFAARLGFETDPSDVIAAHEAGERFVLIDVRGDAAWQQGHVPWAVHLPRGDIAARAGELEASIPIVVHCWGPACNGGVKAALELSALGFRVKEMLGGFEYWAREGLPVHSAAGSLTRAADPLSAPIEGGAAAVAALAAGASPGAVLVGADAESAIRCDC